MTIGDEVLKMAEKAQGKDDGGPAFPVVAENGLGHIWEGMTLRDYFAGQAIVGMLSHNGLHADKSIGAREAYVIADAMIAQRKK